MIKVSDVLSRLSILLMDEDFIRWEKAELIGWMNDAVGEIVVRRPAAGGRTITATLSAGVLQSVEDNVILIFDIIRNLPNGIGIHIAERQRLEEADPDWYSTEGTTSIKHYCYDNRVPNKFYVYPPAAEGAQVEMSVSMTPAIVTDEAEEIDIAEEYISPIVSYCMYRAMMKDAEYSNAQISVAYFQAFSEALGTNTQMTLANSATEAKA